MALILPLLFGNETTGAIATVIRRLIGLLLSPLLLLLAFIANLSLLGAAWQRLPGLHGGLATRSNDGARGAG